MFDLQLSDSSNHELNQSINQWFKMVFTSHLPQCLTKKQISTS